MNETMTITISPPPFLTLQRFKIKVWWGFFISQMHVKCSFNSVLTFLGFFLPNRVRWRKISLKKTTLSLQMKNMKTTPITAMPGHVVSCDYKPEYLVPSKNTMKWSGPAYMCVSWLCSWLTSSPLCCIVLGTKARFGSLLWQYCLHCLLHTLQCIPFLVTG